MKTMSTDHTPPSARPRPRKDSRQRVRAAHPAAATFIQRVIPPYEMLDEEQLAGIEKHADRILQEIGMEIRGDAAALQLWKDAGADIVGDSRVIVPLGLATRIVKRSAPQEFVQHSWNPARSVTIGGRATVFAPAYG